ncbi:hypothetical protein [Bradyrhizobium liaoningense]
MSEVASFGNIVSSLRAVRNDYNEHLKAVPQYEAFLLVEGSTRKVADTLRDVAPQMAADVVEALEAAKAKFQQHLTDVAEYRALLAIDKLINDVAADLNVTGPTAVRPEATPQQVDAVAELEAIPTEPAELIGPIAVTASAPVEVVQVDDAPQAEFAEQTASSARAAATEVEMASAEAISQIQAALLHAEPSTAEFARSESRETSSSEATEPVAGSDTSDPHPTVEAEPPTYGHEAERAA